MIENKSFKDNSQNVSAINDKLWRLSKVCEYVCLSKSSIYQMIKQSRFPSPVRIGARAVAWHSADVMKWIKDCPTTNSK